MPPVPASRPRVTRWGVYYTKTYTTWREMAERATPRGELNLSADVPLLVVIESVVLKPRTSKLKRPKGDVDNYAKAPMDCITQAEGYWYDDEQIIHLLSSKRFANPGEEPRTLIEIYRWPD